MTVLQIAALMLSFLFVEQAEEATQMTVNISFWFAKSIRDST
jgi:hypothetical protein